MDPSGALYTIESLNSGANRVSKSLRLSVIGAAEGSGKFRRLVAGPKLLCSEANHLSSGPKLSCSEAIQLSPGFVLMYTKAMTDLLRMFASASIAQTLRGTKCGIGDCMQSSK